MNPIQPVEEGEALKSIRIFGFAGSLRNGSYNKLLLRAARELLPNDAQLELFDLDGIPLYNQDTEVHGIPESVKRFKEKIESADALLIATPEYNHSYPGVLKNAIDWASRPYGRNSFKDKAVAVISATPGAFGGVAAQDQLKQVLLAVNTHLVVTPAVIVASAHQKFDQQGNLTDEDTKQFLTGLLSNLTEQARLLASRSKPTVENITIRENR
jgi:chromate reductase